MSGEIQAFPKVFAGYEVVFVAYSPEDDQFFLVSHDETTALPLPRDIQGHIADLIKDEEHRLGCHPGFVPWPPEGTSR